MVFAAMWERRVGLAPAALACALACACTAYDEGLLPDTPSGGPLLAPGGTGGDISGSGGTGGSVSAGTSGIVGGGGGSGGGAVTPPPQRPATCGDGVLAESEVCDTGIAEDDQGACPTECPPLAACLPQRIEGMGCTTRCVPDPPTCMDGDGCCPSECTADTDADCSKTCGDGTVQTDEGETCEPDSTTDPCPSDCDDQDPCTMDVLEGNASNCNATCAHVDLGAAPDDNCCPEGANANTDNDCPGDCGNGVREPGEECDGGVGCSAMCKLTVTAEQQECLDARVPGSVDAACEECQCLQCTQLMLDCLLDSDATRGQACETISECALQANCTGTACYCGPTTTLCGGLFGPAMGPCASEIETAAGTNDPVVIQTQAGDTTTAVGRANALGNCGAMQCADVCP